MDAAAAGIAGRSGEEPGRPRRKVRSGVIGVIRAYQLARSGRASPCRFVPSCSEYAVEAVERHGLGRGGALAVRRVLRCHPWGGHGIDMVPERSGSR